MKNGLNLSTVAATAKQSKAIRSLSPTQNRIKGIQKNGFSGSGFTREHSEPTAKIQLQAVD
jgi:hypothetical protein